MFIVKISDICVNVINYCNNKVVAMNYFDFDGCYELTDDVLIINWSNGITHYYIKNGEVYEHVIFNNFDIVYYSLQRNKFLTWDNCFKDWLLIGRKQNISYKQIFILYIDYQIRIFDKVTDIYLIDDNKIHYFFEINGSILVIDNVSYYLFGNNIWVHENTEFYDTIIQDWNCIKNYEGYKIENGFFVLNDKIIITPYKFFKNYNIYKIQNTYYSVENKIYLNEHNIPNNFDWVYYLKKIEHVNYDTLTKEEAYELYLRYGGNYVDNSTILINNEIVKITINHSFNKIFGLNFEEFCETIAIINNSVLQINLLDGEPQYYSKLNEDYYEIINYRKQTVFDTITKVYIVSNLNGGGAVKYLNDITNKYKDVAFDFIKCNDDLLKHSYDFTDLIFIQHLFLTDIKLEDIIQVKINQDPRIMISIHDFYWIENNDVERTFENQVNAPWHSSYLYENITINKNIIKLFELCDDIIHPSLFSYKNYSKYFDNYNFNLVYHNDYEEYPSIINYNPIENNVITIGILHELTTYKGLDQINFLMNNFKEYKNYTINYLVVYKNLNSYKEPEFNDVIIKNKINGFFLLNKWGETHCYLLTKIFNIGLPLIYNNFGAFKERINPKKNYFKVYDSENDDDLISLSFSKLVNMYHVFLDNIIQNSDKPLKMPPPNILRYNLYYETLFSKIEKKEKTIKPYAVYFPQFHSFEENNINYYEGFSDIQNLKKYLEDTDNNENLQTPNFNVLNIENLDKYNITNKNLQNTQIDIAKKYGLAGFAIYYYWFSQNTITEKNSIMEKGYDYFFENPIDNFNFYFIWANEDWSGNAAFNTKNLILNIYDEENYNKNLKNLLRYFKNDNYLKINNKPVFYIHHPQFIENLDILRFIFDNYCKNNGFDGIHLMFNNINSSINTNNMYEFHPNYKQLGVSIYYDENKKAVLNYEKYIENNVIVNNENPNCVFFDFNNSARLYIPNKLQLKTMAINNSFKNTSLLIKKIINSYKKYNKKNNILLLNAWNEWGEKMNIEPSNEYGYKYLNIINDLLHTNSL